MTTMTERPLEQIRRETKVAQRTPHLRKKNITPTDQIDSLDNITGFAYHHDGPYDATLASRNRNPKYAPVEAVKESNMEALKATPIEHIQDSLRKKVPLSGTAVIPPGEEDFAGRRMDYEEGADLMREEEAGGGPYRRWKDYDYKYSPEDLKGKGEEGFRMDRRAKANPRSEGLEGTGVYEMQPSGRARGSSSSSPKGPENYTMVRQRSYSSGAGPSSPRASGSGVDRSNTSGKRLSIGGIKRRIGSLRRKSNDSDYV
ncbi:hypothetical protein KJ359_013135 [Pestalotiopsis sp. 9143b]|nr:hypothetical protein KJ359_013135 [Pestalotiopsis sp. 9143b]